MNSSFSEGGRPLSMHPHDFPQLLSPYDYLQLRPMGMESRPLESYNPRQMKQLVDEMRFKQKMETINRKKGKYKRSTNNCHKKYIGIIKNLVCLKLNNDVKEQMLDRFFPYRNSRVYYFIILSFLKWHLSSIDIRWVLEHFILEVSNKIQRYRLEINITSNSNFIHFRRDEIVEMEFSIDSIYNFLKGNEEEAMKILYQKNKYIIIKKNQYLKTLQIIKDLKEELQLKFEEVDIEQKQREIELEEVYHWRQPTYQNMNEFNPPGQREWPSERAYEPMEKEVRLKEQRISERYESEDENGSHQFPNQIEMLQKNMLKVKQEEQIAESEKKFPLMGLENSYPVIDFITWHSWLIQKQKSLEFYIKSKEETMNPMNTHEEPFFGKPPMI